MTARQYNEYQRQATVIEQHAQHKLIHDQIDQLQDEINQCMRTENLNLIPDLQASIEHLKEQLRNGQ